MLLLRIEKLAEGDARNGFTPGTRESLLKQMRKLEVKTCPFRNLPEPRGGRWGQGLNPEKMKNCVWVKPELVRELNSWNGRQIIICAMRDSLGSGMINAHAR